MAVPVSSPSQIDQRAIRAGLGLSRERMARIFDVSAKTIERWETTTNRPKSLPDRKLLSDLAEIVEVGELVYGVEGFHEFLSTPLATFAGSTPLQVLMRGEQERVLQALAQDYDGLGG